MSAWMKSWGKKYSDSFFLFCHLLLFRFDRLLLVYISYYFGLLFVKKFQVIWKITEMMKLGFFKIFSAIFEITIYVENLIL